MKLSKDGDIYEPNPPGEAWTKQKKGGALKLRESVSMINLQTKPKKGPL